MSPKLILIAGLPASGKSTRVRELSRRLKSDVAAPVTFGDWAGWKCKNHREELYERVRAGDTCIVESAGFCIQPHLTDVVAEIKRRFPDVEVEIECFDNNPLQCIRLSLQDTNKKYSGNGALARVSQILRDCSQYRPDVTGATIAPVYPCEAVVGYQPGRYPKCDNVLEWLRSTLSQNGRRLEAADFKGMPRQRQDVMTEEARELVDRSGLLMCKPAA